MQNASQSKDSKRKCLARVVTEYLMETIKKLEGQKEMRKCWLFHDWEYLDILRRGELEREVNVRLSGCFAIPKADYYSPPFYVRKNLSQM